MEREIGRIEMSEMADTAQPALFPPAPPPAPAPPLATPAERAELLVRLRARRRELVDAYAVGLTLGELVVLSAVQPLAVVQQAIVAVEDELAEGRP